MWNHRFEEYTSGLISLTPQPRVSLRTGPLLWATDTCLHRLRGLMSLGPYWASWHSSQQDVHRIAFPCSTPSLLFRCVSAAGHLSPHCYSSSHLSFIVKSHQCQPRGDQEHARQHYTFRWQVIHSRSSCSGKYLYGNRRAKFRVADCHGSEIVAVHHPRP